MRPLHQLLAACFTAAVLFSTAALAEMKTVTLAVSGMT
jgi:hypothetical protein